jgi:hypothetical protein
MLNAHAHFDKHLLRLSREFEELRSRRHIHIPLAEPIQRGWKRFHVLSPEAEKRADHATLREILKQLGTMQFRRSPDFRDRRGRGRRRRYIEIEQPLRELNAGQWHKQTFPDDWTPYFRREPCCEYRRWHDVFVFRNPEIFSLKIEPHWMTHAVMLDPAIEERIAEIETQLAQHDARYRLGWLLDNSRRWYGRTRRQNLLERVACRELREAQDGLAEVDSRASKECAGIGLRRSRTATREGGRAEWTLPLTVPVFGTTIFFVEMSPPPFMTRWFRWLLYAITAATARAETQPVPLDAERAKAALIELIRREPKAFPGNPKPDELAKLPLLREVDGRFTFGGVRLDLKDLSYSLVLGANGLATAFIDGKFTQKDGAWRADLPTVAYAQKPLPPK